MGGQDINESQDTLAIIKDKAHTAGHTVASTAQHTFGAGTVWVMDCSVGLLYTIA